MPRIAAVAPVLPENTYSQLEIAKTFASLITTDPLRRKVIEKTHAACGIKTRHLALPKDRYASLQGTHETNALFIPLATELCEKALRGALEKAGLEAKDVDFMLFTTVTGIAAPSIDALLISRLRLREDVKRLPSFGLGCMAGAAGIARLNDYLKGHPMGVGVLISVEICSLTFQREDLMVNIVSSGLFGDGGAAVVMVGDEHPCRRGPKVIATQSTTFPNSENILAFNIGKTGL